jgi:hypothetical protein
MGFLIGALRLEAGGVPCGREPLKTLAALLIGRWSRSIPSSRLASLSNDTREASLDISADS